MKAQRIGHGVQAVQDKKLLKYLAENKIALEICPTSNFKTSVIPQGKEHPVKEIFEAKVPVTLSTDDPTFFGTNLLQEYEYLSQIGMSHDSIFQIIQNGFQYAFLEEKKKKKYLESLEMYRNAFH